MNVFCLQSSAHPEAFAKLLAELMAVEDKETLIRILTTIDHVASVGGHPHEPTSSRLSGVDLCEIKSKFHHGKLIRIYYYVDKNLNRMLLLNSIIKPNGSNHASRYEGNAGTRLEKDLKQSIDLALELKDRFPSSSTRYDPLFSLLQDR